MYENPAGESQEGRLFIYPKTELIINNGEDLISIDRGAVAHELSSHGLSEESIMKLLSVVNDYEKIVGSERAKGVHVGSNDLPLGVESLFADKKYNDFSLGDPHQLDLATEVIKRACVRKRFIPGKIE